MSRKTALVALLGAILSYHCLADGLSMAKKEEVLRGLASEMNKKLPMMLDASTRHDSTMAGPGEKLTNILTLIDFDVTNENSAKHKAAVRRINNEIYPSTIRGMCSTPSTRKGIDLGVTFAYMYRDARGIYITTTYVDKNICRTNGL